MSVPMNSFLESVALATNTMYYNDPAGGLYGDGQVNAFAMRPLSKFIAPDGLAYSQAESLCLGLLLAGELYAMTFNELPPSAFPPGANYSGTGSIDFGGTPAVAEMTNESRGPNRSALPPWDR